MNWPDLSATGAMLGRALVADKLVGTTEVNKWPMP